MDTQTPPVAPLAPAPGSASGESPAVCDPIDECVRLSRELTALRTKIGQIAFDYLPDNDSEAPHALGEMREAIFALLEKPSHPAYQAIEDWKAIATSAANKLHAAVLEKDRLRSKPL